MTIEHDSILDPEIHEPKGVASALPDKVYVSNGAGGGDWQDPPVHEPKDIDTVVGGLVYVSNGLGGGAWQSVPVPVHEPKDIDTASVDEVYVADGAGSGDWGSVPVPIHEPKDIDTAAVNEVYVADGAGGGNWEPPPTVTRQGFIHLNDNVTDTVISSINTPVLIAGVWTVRDVDNFTGTAAGRLTQTGPMSSTRSLISVTLTIQAASAITARASIALDGVVQPSSRKSQSLATGETETFTLIWTEALSPGSFLEVFIENTVDTVDILVTDASFLVR